MRLKCFFFSLPSSLRRMLCQTDLSRMILECLYKELTPQMRSAVNSGDLRHGCIDRLSTCPQTHWRDHMVRVVDQAVTQTLKWPKLRQIYRMERVLSISQGQLLQAMNPVPHQVFLSIYSWAYYCWWFLLQLWCKTSVQSFQSLSLFLEVILPH